MMPILLNLMLARPFKKWHSKKRKNATNEFGKSLNWSYGIRRRRSGFLENFFSTTHKGAFPWAAVVAQLAEWSLPILEDPGLNPVIGNFY